MEIGYEVVAEGSSMKKFLNKDEAFTLIELLVVVAIIGILAAVGVVAYNGYTKAAQIASLKTNHKTIAKFIVSKIKECELGASQFYLLTNSGANQTVACSKNNVDTYGLAFHFVNHFNGSGGFKATLGLAKGTQVSINNSGNNLVIAASYTDPADTNKIINLETTIADDR